MAGERPNLADGLFWIERAKNRTQLVAALDWMRNALAKAGNPEVDAATLRWFSDVYIPSRACVVDVEWLASWKEAPEMVEQHIDSWADAWIANGVAQGMAKGIAEGKEQGAEAGRKELLMKLVRRRYGTGTANTIAPLLDAVHSLPTLEEIGLCLVEGTSAEALIAKIRAL